MPPFFGAGSGLTLVGPGYLIRLRFAMPVVVGGIFRSCASLDALMQTRFSK
jgi:hypothetical protein